MKNSQPVISFLSCIRRDYCILYGLIVFRCMVFVVLLLTGHSSFAAEGCVTADCHATMGKAEFVHEPVTGDECEACHAETGKIHPEESDAFELTEQGAALCLQCHEKPGEGKEHVHPPVEEDCIHCHSPHQGSRRKFLHNSTGQLCLSCHEKIGSIIQDSKSQHKPVSEGECLVCHVPHGSDYSPLLNTYYPRNTYIKFEKKNFALCFECHESEAFTLERTVEATSFRNGDKNLHYRHVNSAKGRVCVNCHGVHGGDLAKLIHSSSPAFGVWNIPIDFQKTGTGATCIIGCHKEKSYDRVKGVVNP